MRDGTRRAGPIPALALVFFLAWGLSGPFAAAQSNGDADSTRSDAVPLGEALEQLATTARVSLVYDADLVQNASAACAVDEARPERTLQCLLEDTRLDYVQTSGGTYVVKEDVRRPPRRGAVRGVVREADTGAPLPRAHVRVDDGNTGAVADANGQFRIAGLAAGRQTLVVSHLGYETTQVDVSVSADSVVHAPVVLAPSSITADPLVVNAPTVEHLAPSREHARLSPDRLEQPSGVGTPSVLHAAGTLMGVTTRAPYADLHVQGGASSEHEVRLDGVPVRNPAATGRLLGAFSPLALDGLTARKAGFGALRGNALSGIVELEHDLQRDGARRFTLQADPVSVNGRAEGVVEGDETTATVMGAGRMSVWNLHQAEGLTRLIDTWSVLDPVLTATQLAVDTSLAAGTLDGRDARPRSRFYDLHGAAHVTFDRTQSLYVSAYHGRSRLGSDLVVGQEGTGSTSDGSDSSGGSGGVEVPTSDRYEWANTVAQARYETRFRPRVTGTLQASLSHYRADSDFEVGELRGIRENDAHDHVLAQFAQSQQPSGSQVANDVTEIGLDGTLDVELAGRNRIVLSGEMTTMDTRVQTTNAFVGAFHHTDRALQFTTAGQAEVGLGAFTTLEGSVRLTSRPRRGPMFVEPRAALRYHRPDTQYGDVALRIGGGVYRRYTTQFELSRDGATAVVPTAQVWMPVPAGLSPPRTYHLATDVTWSPHSAWTVGLEGYAKWEPHLLAVDYPALRSVPSAGTTRPAEVLSGSRGRAYGGGLDVTYDGALGMGALRYSFTVARRTFPGRFEGDRVPVPWNEPHRVTLEGQVPLGDVVALDVQGNGIWGRSWGYRRAYYAYLPPEAVEEELDLEDPARHVLPPLYRVDAGIAGTYEWERVEVTGRVGLVNVFDRSNVADWGLRPTGDGDVTCWPRTLPGRRSVVSLRIRY